MAARVSPDHDAIVVDESGEPAEFWDALGGHGAYDTTLDPTTVPFLDPRLFHCSIRYNGRLRVEEVAQFEQEDLNVDDIMVLDGGDEVYIWIGTGSTEEEKKKAEEMAMVFWLAFFLWRQMISSNSKYLSDVHPHRTVRPIRGDRLLHSGRTGLRTAQFQASVPRLGRRNVGGK